MGRKNVKLGAKLTREPSSYSTDEITELRRRAETVGMRVIWIDSRKPFLVRVTPEARVGERWVIMDEIELMDAIVTRRMDGAPRSKTSV